MIANKNIETLLQSYSDMLKKEIIQSYDTQCTKGDCDVIWIKNESVLIIMHLIHSMCVFILFII